MLLSLMLAQTLDVSAGQLPDPPANFPYTSNAGIDLGCYGAPVLGGSRFDSQFIDPVHRETILYNMSRCTGGFVRGTREVDGRFWRLQVSPSREISGTDLDGRRWTYSRLDRMYVVTSTHAKCARPDYRHMCRP